MKKTLFLVAAAAMLGTMPAAAQYGGDRWADFDARLNALQARLDAGISSGAISRREAWPLRQELRGLMRLEARYSLGGYSAGERDDLRRRIRDLRQDIRIADNGRWDRNDRFAWGGVDRSYGVGGPIDDVCIDRGGVGGFVDRVLGRDCLTIGDRVRGNLGGVPYAYRNTYRDGGGVYYRSDGRVIYEIDARTGTVIDIHGPPD